MQFKLIAAAITSLAIGNALAAPAAMPEAAEIHARSEAAAPEVEIQARAEQAEQAAQYYGPGYAGGYYYPNGYFIRNSYYYPTGAYYYQNAWYGNGGVQLCSNGYYYYYC